MGRAALQPMIITRQNDRPASLHLKFEEYKMRGRAVESAISWRFDRATGKTANSGVF